MLQSKLFTKTRKEAPADEVSLNAKLLTRAGFINKEMAGVYDYLPLGLRVLEKIKTIIREEMNTIGGQEVSLSILQDPEIFKQTNRWDDKIVDNWFKTKLKNDSELGLGLTHEEPLTALLKNHVHSYRDLPIYPYQIGTKFRNELRAKSGIMRGREFMMKDMYSYSRTEEEHSDFYEKSKIAYNTIFERVGLGDRTFITVASGGIFTSEFSHEFQTLSPTGEDTIYLSRKNKIAVNKEVYNDETLKKLDLKKEDLDELKGIEVGNIFPLGTRFSESLGLFFVDEKGEKHPVVMGSYGIGPSRVMGTIVEVLSDEKGIVWPESVAPFKIHLIEIAGKEGKGVRTHAEKLYSHLVKEGVEVLMDDRDIPAGAKFADSDLIGIPYRVIVSEKTISEGRYELMMRVSGEVKLVSEKELLELLGISTGI